MIWICLALTIGAFVVCALALSICAVCCRGGSVRTDEPGAGQVAATTDRERCAVVVRHVRV